MSARDYESGKMQPGLYSTVRGFNNNQIIDFNAYHMPVGTAMQATQVPTGSMLLNLGKHYPTPMIPAMVYSTKPFVHTPTKFSAAGPQNFYSVSSSRYVNPF